MNEPWRQRDEENVAHAACSKLVRTLGFRAVKRARFWKSNKEVFWRENGFSGNPGNNLAKKSTHAFCSLVASKPYSVFKCFSFFVYSSFFICANTCISICFYFFVGVKGGREGAVRESKRELRGRLFNTGSGARAPPLSTCYLLGPLAK